MPNFDSITPEELGYIAGFIDGEGTIGLRCSVETRERRSKGLSGWYHPIIRISNTNLEVIEFIYDKLGGSISVIKPKGNSKQAYSLSWSSQSDVEVILRAIINLLITRRPQAEMLLAWLEVHSYNIDGVDIDAFFKTELNRVNKKGRQEYAEH